MKLTAAERRLLEHIAGSAAPLAMSDYFVLLNPLPAGVVEGHPWHDAWMARQITWFEVSVRLVEKDLVYVAAPADGIRPDLVGITHLGSLALADRG